MSSPRDILEFWFSDRARALWFEKDAAFDADIRARFGPRVHQAQIGDRDRQLRHALHRKQLATAHEGGAPFEEIDRRKPDAQPGLVGQRRNLHLKRRVRRAEQRHILRNRRQRLGARKRRRERDRSRPHQHLPPIDRHTHALALQFRRHHTSAPPRLQ